MVWNSLASCSSHLCAKELYEDIKKAYEDNLVDPFFIGLEDVDTYQSMGWEENLKSLQKNKTIFLKKVDKVSYYMLTR